MKPASSAINSLYILKCLFAFLVVTCHTPMGVAKVMLQPIAMGAVCVFFLISGYFLYSPQAEKSYQRAVKSLRSTVKIFLVVSLFYWAWLLPNNGNLLNSFHQLGSLLLTGSLFSGHTWYLMAMIQGLLVLALVFAAVLLQPGFLNLKALQRVGSRDVFVAEIRVELLELIDVIALRLQRLPRETDQTLSEINVVRRSFVFEEGKAARAKLLEMLPTMRRDTHHDERITTCIGLVT